MIFALEIVVVFLQHYKYNILKILYLFIMCFFATREYEKERKEMRKK